MVSIEEIKNNILVDNESGCWNWIRAKTFGYGVVAYPKKITRVHRIMYENYYGDIPSGMQIDHLCRNRACCNPKHLEAVTQKTNLYRGENPKIVAHINGTCVKGHDKKNFYIRKNGQVAYCRICKLNRIHELAKLRRNYA